MRFRGLSLSDAVQDANAIWTFHEVLKKANSIDAFSQRFDASYLVMGGQIVDAAIIAAPKQRNTSTKTKAIKEDRIPDYWKCRPKKLAQKDRDARWTIKHANARLARGTSISPSRP